MQTAIRSEETYFEGADERRLFERRWRPADSPKATLVIVHGYAEHSGRYAYAGEQIAARGYDVRAYDLRGHGNSDGRRTHVRSFNEHLRDLDAVLTRVAVDDADRPTFLLGHSMGGSIVALAAAVREPAVRGIVLSGAALPVQGSGLRLMQRLVRIVGRIVPRLPLIKLKAADVSRTPEVVALYDADPLNYRGRMSAGLLAAMMRASDTIDARAGHITAPLLFLHGSADVLTSVAGSRRLHERASSADKTLRVYDGLYHEILNEPERDTVIRDIVGWMDDRLG
jgi:alpha-beta hydrolase superfamily lysophospholipase